MILKFLLSNDADIFLRNKDGQNALDYSLAMNHRTSYGELQKIVGNSCDPPRFPEFPRTRSCSERKLGRKFKHKVSKSGPDGLFRSVSALNLTQSSKLSDLSFSDIPESPRLPTEHGLRLRPSHSEQAPDKTSSQKPYAKRYSVSYGPYGDTAHCHLLAQHEQQHQEMVHRMQTYPLCGGQGVVPSTSCSTMTSNVQCSPNVERWGNHKNPLIMNPNYMASSNLNRRKSKSRLFGHFGSKRGHKRLSQESCKSCIILQNEVLKLRNEREVLQRKMTTSVHGLVLQKEFVRKQEVELRILKRKLQAMFAQNKCSPSPSPTVWRSVGVEHEQYFVEDFIMDNELDMLSDSPPARVRRVSDLDKESADEHTEDGLAFSFPKTDDVALLDDEKSIEIPSYFAMDIELSKTAGPSRRGRRRGALTECPPLSGALATNSAAALNLRACHSKKSSVGLAQSVTDDVAHSVHSMDDGDGGGVHGVDVNDDHGDDLDDDEKSASLDYDHYDEEYAEMMPIMEGLEGVHLTTAGNPGPSGSNLKEFHIERADSDDLKVSTSTTGIKHPALLSPHSVDPGMDDDLSVTLCTVFVALLFCCFMLLCFVALPFGHGSG